jgi:hypothetical protein
MALEDAAGRLQGEHLNDCAMSGKSDAGKGFLLCDYRTALKHTCRSRF